MKDVSFHLKGIANESEERKITMFRYGCIIEEDGTGKWVRRKYV